MFTSPYPLELSGAERAELEAMTRSRTLAAGLVQRARVILGMADGEPYGILCARVDASTTTLTRWRKRFEQHRLAGLHDAPRSGRGDRLAPRLEAKILALTQQPPPRPYTHWTTRRLASRLGINHMTVHRVWQRAGLKPHRLERYVASSDPDFEQKAADIIGLYLNPPEHAVVLSIDEKTTIQALDRRDPVLPLSPGRAERHGFEYVRHGALSLYAALNVGTGQVEGMTAARHTSQDFIAFLDRVIAKEPKRRDIHLILDNFSAHKTKAVAAWLGAHPRVHVHYTPTYSSWLNQVELWFAKIERDCIARGIFTSS
ncbi:MAG: IS630 family transposase, partial [Gemmatimonadaceae bacterium]